MALLFPFLFELNTDSTKHFDGTQSASNNTIGAGAGGRNALIQTDSGLPPTTATKNLGTTVSTIIMQSHIKIPVANGYLFAFLDNGTFQAGLWVDSDGTAHCTGTTTTFYCSLGVHHYFKVKCLFGAAGHWTVYLDGTLVVDATADTQSSANAYCTQFIFGYGGNGAGRTYTNTILMDTTGSAPFNDFISETVVDAQMPSTAGDSTQWTPSTGTNVSCVDETDANGTTDNVTAATVGLKDLYNCGASGVTSGTVYGVIPVWLGSKSDAGTAGITGKVKQGGSEMSTAELGLSTSSVYSVPAPITTNAATGNPFTISDLTSIQVGVARTA